MPKKKTHTTPEQDKQRFIDAAGELECDVTDEDFASTVNQVMQAPAFKNADLKAKRKPKE
jgi:hypothetical protein